VTHTRAPEGLAVDVYITTYNESPDLLRSTILGALNMRYRHETYVLDDGHRSEVRRLAEGLGARYISRADNLHAKAGNINHALALTSGDFIAIFDADHVPHPQFLERTLGRFSDQRVALVQTPQEFYNVDSIPARRRGKGRRGRPLARAIALLPRHSAGEGTPQLGLLVRQQRRPAPRGDRVHRRHRDGDDHGRHPHDDQAAQGRLAHRVPQ
jgi:glycosyltransferase involved in cell wall biosynthesis